MLAAILLILEYIFFPEYAFFASIFYLKLWDKLYPIKLWDKRIQIKRCFLIILKEVKKCHVLRNIKISFWFIQISSCLPTAPKVVLVKFHLKQKKRQYFYSFQAFLLKVHNLTIEIYSVVRFSLVCIGIIITHTMFTKISH